MHIAHTSPFQCAGVSRVEAGADAPLCGLFSAWRAPLEHVSFLCAGADGPPAAAAAGQRRTGAAQSQASDKCRHCTGGGGAGTDVTPGQRIGPSAPVPSVPIRSARNCVRPQIATVFACAQLCEVHLAGICYSGVCWRSGPCRADNAEVWRWHGESALSTDKRPSAQALRDRR